MTSTDSSTTPTTAPTVIGGEIFYDTPLGKQAEHSLEKIEEEVFLQAFAVEGDDDVKIAARIEIELALTEAKSDTATWTSEFDDNADIVGTVNEHCERYRRKVDEPLFPSFAFDDRIPNTTKSSFQLPLQVETTGFTIPAKEGHDLTRNLRWEVVRVSFPQGTTFYGTGENPGNLALNDLFQYQPNTHARQYDRPKPLQTRKADLKLSHTSTRFNRNRNLVCCWNTDACFYDENFESLYQSHPWVVAVLPDGTSYGVFVDWTYRTVMHFYEAEMGTQNPLQVYFICEAPKSAPPMYLFHGKNVAEIITQLTNLTGRIEMPPYWALGYQQCRYSYFPDNAVRAVADSFREKQIPCDVMWFDIHYMDGYRCFTFDPVHFPNPIDLNAYLHSTGFKTVYMIDPGIKNEKGYSVYDSGVEQDVFIKKDSKSTSDRIGSVWPGEVVFPDFTMERTRKWWASLFPKWISHGVDGTWNDMNEIASFQPGGTIPSTSYHRADEGFGGPDEHARYHNVYGLMMARSTFNGFKQTNPNKRSFVLTRANYMGGHKYAACWTGDNTSDWKHLHFSIPMILNLGLSGQPFTGIDIGGFFYNASPEMYARWVGVGSLLPFARAHSCDDTEPHEPWSFGKETEDSCRRSISRRYRLLPYMYTLFRESTLNGLPVARPLFFADFKDPSLREVDDSFLIGEDLLVRAITIQFEKKNYSPIPSNHNWAVIYLLNDPEEKTDIAHPELRIRQGAILPLGPVVQNTSERLLDPLTLYVYLDQHGHAEGSLYEDAGDGHEHKDGDYTLSKFVAQKEGNQITVTTSVVEGNRAPLTRKVIVKFVGETAPNDKFHEGSDPNAKIVVTV